MSGFLNSVIEVLLSLVAIAMSAYLLVNGVRGLRKRYMRLEWRATIELAGAQALTTGAVFAICGLVSGIAIIWAAYQIVFAGAMIATPSVSAAIVVWVITIGIAVVLANGLALYNIFRVTSALHKLIWLGVLILGCVVGGAVWLWIKANP